MSFLFMYSDTLVILNHAFNDHDEVHCDGSPK